MRYFRNPEIKREIVVVLLLWSTAVLAGGLLFPGGAWFAAVVGGVFVLFHFLSSYHRYQKIRRLSEEISYFLHGWKVSIEQQDEGELSILQNEISRMVARLKKQTEELSEDKVFLSDSIADISHQIRTPLTTLNLIVSRLRGEKLKPEKRKALLYDLEGLLDHMDWLVQTLLKISKLDAGTIKLQQARVSVRELVELSTEALLIPMELRQQNLVLEIEEGASYTGDMAWTKEALGNIVKNCIEHTPEGGEIRIRARENPIFTEICVEDNGPGISSKDLPHLFERFYKGENSSEKSVGIGLALARMIVGRQNGTLTAENRREGGACFVMHFYKGTV